MYGFASHPFASFATSGPSSSSGFAPCKPTSPSFSPFGYTSSPRCVYQDDSHATLSDDGDDDDDDLDRYYEYLDVARRAREHQKLEEAQARRHAQEQVYLRVKAQAEHEAKVRAAAEARRRYEAQQEKEYRRRQHQAAVEYRARQEAEYRARQEAAFQARKEAEYRAAMDAQARARVQAQAQAQAQARARAQQEQKARQAEAERIRRIQAAYQEDLLKHLFGSYVSHQQREQQQNMTSAPTTRPASVPEPTKPAATPAPQTQPQLERRPSVTSDHSSSSSMSREEAVTVIQTLAKQQISLRRRIGTVKSIRSRFETLKSEYQHPESLVFNVEKSTPSAPVLAYTPINRPLQAYEEALTRILTELDEISSQGSDKVKKERKALASDVQKELDRLDGVEVVEWARQSVQQRHESTEGQTTESSAAPETEETSVAADAPEVTVAVEPISTKTATTAKAAPEPTTKEDTMEVDAPIEDGHSQELPESVVQAENIEPATAPLVLTVDTHNGHLDADSDSTDTEQLISDPIDAQLPAPAITQDPDLQLDSDSTIPEPRQAHLEHTSVNEVSHAETDPHPTTSTFTAADNFASIFPSAADITSSAEEASEKPSVHPFSIPGLISEIVRESYGDMDKDEKETADDEMRSESNGSETSFEML